MYVDLQIVRKCIFVFSLSFCCCAEASAIENWTLKLKLRGQQVEGSPISWSSQSVLLLARDGRLWDFAPQEAVDFERFETPFRSYSQAEMRASLLREFGSRFDVSGTGHFLVVHPRGQRDQWAQRFEDLYRSLIHYFSARGFRTQKPQFPLVAVVFHKQQDYLRFASKDGVRNASGTLGYYSLDSNRILLYDVTAGKKGNRDWHTNAETIIHEATHQSAYNLGIHNRLAETPRWLVEGLAVMFEAPGVWNSQAFPERSHRIQHTMLKKFKKYAGSRRKRDTIVKMIASDKAFNLNPNDAYLDAWSLTFYLAETQPKKYTQFLAKTAALPDQKPYAPIRRLKDFTDIFGKNFTMFDTRLLRFYKELK